MIEVSPPAPAISAKRRSWPSKTSHLLTLSLHLSHLTDVKRLTSSFATLSWWIIHRGASSLGIFIKNRRSAAGDFLPAGSCHLGQLSWSHDSDVICIRCRPIYWLSRRHVANTWSEWRKFKCENAGNASIFKMKIHNNCSYLSGELLDTYVFGYILSYYQDFVYPSDEWNETWFSGTFWAMADGLILRFVRKAEMI